MNVPENLKYTKSHEWVRLEGDTATIGITDYAQSELGDIVFVELPPVGKSVNAGDSLGTVESVKTVSDIYAPISGAVVEVNGDLGKNSELLNSDPYGQGWVVKIRANDKGNELMDAAKYKAAIEH